MSPHTVQVSREEPVVFSSLTILSRPHKHFISGAHPVHPPLNQAFDLDLRIPLLQNSLLKEKSLAKLAVFRARQLFSPLGEQP
jgi:hypothetical protein